MNVLKIFMDVNKVVLIILVVIIVLVILVFLSTQPTTNRVMISTNAVIISSAVPRTVKTLLVVTVVTVTLDSTWKTISSLATVSFRSFNIISNIFPCFACACFKLPIFMVSGAYASVWHVRQRNYRKMAYPVLNERFIYVLKCEICKIRQNIKIFNIVCVSDKLIREQKVEI